jgi:hypothetical protein
MGTIIDNGKADPDAIIRGQCFVFWGNLALALFFLILTACCHDKGGKVLYLGAFFAALYAVCTLIVGVKILRSRTGFFAKTRDFP